MPARWFSRRALGLHATVVFVCAACSVLGWWQLSRALGGNSLSWVYTFEWPFFGLYGIYMWWKLVHETNEDRSKRHIVPARLLPASAEAAETTVELGFDPYDDEEDPELAAYNRYLASLHLDETRHAPRQPAETPRSGS